MKKIFYITIIFTLSFYCLGCDVHKDGLKKEYYDTGELRSKAEYKNFRKHGTYKEYYKNGKIKVEADFQKGKLHGTAKAYDENENLILKELYEAGEITYRSEY